MIFILNKRNNVIKYLFIFLVRADDSLTPKKRKAMKKPSQINIICIFMLKSLNFGDQILEDRKSPNENVSGPGNLS